MAIGHTRGGAQSKVKGPVLTCPSFLPFSALTDCLWTLAGSPEFCLLAAGSCLWLAGCFQPACCPHPLAAQRPRWGLRPLFSSCGESW